MADRGTVNMLYPLDQVHKSLPTDAEWEYASAHEYQQPAALWLPPADDCGRYRVGHHMSASAVPGLSVVSGAYNPNGMLLPGPDST